MTLRFYSVFLFLLVSLNFTAQTTTDEVLFTVADEPVYVSEFVRVYNKNLDLVQDESQKDVDEYLTLFINYKLKLKEAMTQELHTKPSYIRELSNYKKQLAKSYISDSKVTEALVKEAYERISNDVKANHILVRVDETASPQDTLAAYNEILKLRQRTLDEGFDKVRKEVHNGQTVFGEELGYFSGFKMVYKFENVAYNTEIGEVSEPFRTRFGYHIVKVFDKRKSRGERTVAHIMIALNSKDTLSGSPETRIKEIYQKINQGEDFEALAKQFSEDKSSASKGGLLKPFSGGQLSVPIFEEVAFGLDSIGAVSTPFKSQFGWHIVKLYEKIPIDPFEDLRAELEVKVKRDARSKLIDDALHVKLRKRYNVSEEQPALTYFASILDDSYFKSGWKLPEDFKKTEPLVKIGKKQLVFNDFGTYLMKNQRNFQKKAPLMEVVQKSYNTFLNSNLVTYQEENLEFENEDYAHIVGEYRDGLLLFDLMESTIWNAASSDSTEVKNYFEAHKENYYTPRRIDAVVASAAKQKSIKKVAKLLEQGMDVDKIKKLVNSNDKIEVVFSSEIMNADHQALPKDYEFKTGVSNVFKHNDAFVVIKGNEILPKALKTFEEAKGAVISDYQEYKEANWVKELSEKYKIVVNQAALDKVRKTVNN
mgnify:CR=1 FL=1